VPKRGALSRSTAIARVRLAIQRTRGAAVAYDYDLLHVEIQGRALWATIDAPPINLMDRRLFAQLAKFSAEVALDDTISVVVLQSALPDFFIAHFDVEAILLLPIEGPPARAKLGGFHRMCEAYRSMPKATICKIAGRVGGGGSELAASCDMRFGALGGFVVNQIEVPLGILPGGSGTQRLPWLLGRGRALEMILGGQDLDAQTAERWGLLNRALPDDQLDDFVDSLARRISLFPPEAVRLAKASVLAALPDPAEHLVEEAVALQETLRLPGARASMEAFLKLGGQTPAGERHMEELLEAAARAADELVYPPDG
jgi:enoyl-CoA hydratase/carnithine racemase